MDKKRSLPEKEGGKSSKSGKSSSQLGRKIAKTSAKTSSTSIVVKSVPNSIILSRLGKHYTTQTPQTYLALRGFIHEEIGGQDFHLCDLASEAIKDESTYQKFLTTAEKNMLIVYLPGEKVLEKPEEVIVDITPSKNILLKAGTSEYNMSNAIAEFIDNSIQAVRNNPYGSRIIDLTITKPKGVSPDSYSSLQIKDNGCGMNKDELQRWATMGLSQADLEGNASDASQSEITGLISRFGVGGKKAAFYLGNEIKVTTKVMNCDLINQATISLDILNETGDQEWRIPISIRAPDESEKNEDQFTEILINNIRLPTEAFDDTINDLRKDLAHIYYYYLHDMPRVPSHQNLNSAEPSSDEEGGDENEDEAEPMDIDKKHQSRKSAKRAKTGNGHGEDSPTGYRITLNGQNLSTVKDSMESLYIESAKKPIPIELSVRNPQDRENKMIKVLCILRYYPLVDEKETLPVPYKVLEEYKDMDTIPLSMRKPGFEIFWNGRNITEAHIDRLGFMNPGTHEGIKIEEKWIQRIKGAIFLGSEFPVTHSKMHIIKESPIFTYLIERSASRQMITEFRKWLVRCHKLDQDFQFEVDRYDEDKKITLLRSVSFCGETFKPGDCVSFNFRPVLYGTIRNLFFRGREDSRQSEFIVLYERLHYKPGLMEEIPASKIKSHIPQRDYRILEEEMAGRLPYKMRVFEGDTVSLPRTKYRAGELIKWLTVGISNKGDKDIEKRILENEKITITLTITYGPKNEEVYRFVAGEYYRGSRVSFNNIEVLKKVGVYIFTFVCSYSPVKSVVKEFEVEAGESKSISATFKGNLDQIQRALYPIGRELPPVVVNQIDLEGNKIPAVKLYSLKIAGKWQGAQREVKLNDNFKAVLENESIVVTGLRVLEGDLGDDLQSSIQLTIKMSKMVCETPKLTIVAGDPVSMDFSDNIFADTAEGFMNSCAIPDFYISLFDKSSNMCKVETPKLHSPAVIAAKRRGGPITAATVDQEIYHIVASSTVLKEPVVFVSDESGLFTITTVNYFQTAGKKKTKSLPSSMVIQEDVEGLEFETAEESQANSSRLGKRASVGDSKSKSAKHSTASIQFTLMRGEKEVFSTLKNIKVLPSNRPAHVVLTPMSQIFENPNERDSFSTLSGNEVQFSVKVYSLGGGGRGPFEVPVSGSFATAWTSGKTTFSDKSIVILPPLLTDKQAKAMKYHFSMFLDYRVPGTEADEENQPIKLDKEFVITTTGGAPYSFGIQMGKGSSNNIRCDSEATFEIVLMDKKNNLVAPIQENKIEPCLKLMELEGIRATKNFDIKRQQWSEYNYERKCFTCRAVLIGLGELQVRVFDQSGQMVEHSINIRMVEGQASQLKANGVQKLSITCSVGERLEDILFGVCDSQGNPLKEVPQSEVLFDWKSLSPAQDPPPGTKIYPPFDFKSKYKLQSGECLLRNLEIGPEVMEGNYLFSANLKGFQLQPAQVVVNVKGKFSIKLLNPTPFIYHPSDPPPVYRIQLLSPEGEVIPTHKETFKLTFHLKTFVCTRSEDDNTVFVFDNLQSVKKSGQFKITFNHTDRSNKVELVENMTILPDPPAKLEMRGEVNETVSSTFFKTPITVTASDSFGNQCKDLDGSIRLEIEPNSIDPSQGSQNIELPTFASGLTELAFNNRGEAEFADIQLRENIGSSGSYRLCFYYINNNSRTINSSIQPLKKEFFYRNTKEIMDQKLKLQSERITLSNDLQNLSREHSEASKELNTIANRFDLLKRDGDEILHRLIPLIPDLQDPNVNSKPEEIKNITTHITYQIQDMNERRRRAPSATGNYLAREVAESAKSDNQNGIVGLVSDLFCVEDEKEAKCLAKLVGRKFDTVVFDRKDKMNPFYQRYKTGNQPVYFVSLDTILPFQKKGPRGAQGASQSHHQDLGDDNRIPINTLQGAPTHNFVGFAVNRVELREKHEFLRKTLVWSLMKDTMLFRDVPSAMAYRKYCIDKGVSCPTIICTDNGEVLESGGFMEIGQRRENYNPTMFGQIPVSDTPEYKNLLEKKNLLEEYKIRRHKQYQEKKNDYAPQITKLKEKLSQVETARAQKQQHHDHILNELKKLESTSSQPPSHPSRY